MVNIKELCGVGIKRFLFLSIIFILLVVGIVQAGELVAWGSNNLGQTDVPNGTDFNSIDVGLAHNLALKDDGSIVAWGLDTYGESSPPEGNDFVAFAAGSRHNLALKDDGSIVAWGMNKHGESSVPEGNNFVAIAAGSSYSLALKKEGSIVGWGYNNSGQASPVEGNNFVAIAAGSSYGVALLKNDGSIVGWGSNHTGESSPPEGNDFVAIAAGGKHGLALKNDGSIVGWGNNDYGQASPPEGNDFVAIAGGYYHSLALKNDGSIVGWGNNDYGQASPPEGNDFVAIAGGSRHSLALRSTGNCSNGILEYPEECDDGNMVDGDACSNLCHAKETEREFEDVQIDDNDDGTFSYEFVEENNISIISVESNYGLIDMQDTNFKIHNKETSDEIAITGLMLNNTTKSISLPYREMLCAVDDSSFVVESAIDCFKRNEQITWSESDGNACGDTGPVQAKDQNGSWLSQYTCEKFVQDNVTYALMKGFTYTYAATIDDKDFDGIPDDEDQCPLEDSTGFDADVDGCIDNFDDLTESIENLPDDVLADETKNSLASKVENALKSTDKENDEAAINVLEAFKNQVEAQRGKKISDEVADMLIEYATNLINQVLAG